MEELLRLQGGLIKISYREMTVAISSTNGSITLLSNEAYNIFPGCTLSPKGYIRIPDILFSDTEISEFNDFISGSLQMNILSSCLLRFRMNVYLWLDYFPLIELRKSSLKTYYKANETTKNDSISFSCSFLNSLFDGEIVDELRLAEEISAYKNCSPTGSSTTYLELEVNKYNNLDFDFEFGDMFDSNTSTSSVIKLKPSDIQVELFNSF